jgi:hypothetical protein
VGPKSIDKAAAPLIKAALNMAARPHTAIKLIFDDIEISLLMICFST